MMEESRNIKESLSKEVVSIANTLIQSAVEDSEGLKWTIGAKTEEESIVNGAYNIISGNAGIILFFIETYKVHKNEKYLEIIERAKNAMLSMCKNDKSYNCSFYNGKAGVLYTLLQLYSLNNDQQTIAQIEELINDDFTTFIHSKYVNDSLFEGRAGLLLVLNQLYSIINKEYILDLIYQTVEVLISNIKLHDNGFYWTQNEIREQQPISFAYGTSGITYALMGMNNIFGEDYLPFLLKETTKYENSFWDENKANWLISTKHISNYENFILYKKKYLKGEYDFFYEKEDNTTFQDGIIGVGLNRLKAYRIFKEKKLLDDIQKVTQKLQVKSDHTEDCSIATGKAGELFYYLEVSNILRDETYLDLANNEIVNLINSKGKSGKYKFKNNVNDSPLGLIHGLAGLGYIYSIILTSSRNSVIFPQSPFNIDNQHQKYEPIKEPELKEFILAYNLGYMYSFCDESLPEGVGAYLKSEEISKKSFLEYVAKNADKGSDKERLIDFIKLEKEVLAFKHNSQNPLLNHLESWINMEKAIHILNMDNRELEKSQLKLKQSNVRLINRMNSSVEMSNLLISKFNSVKKAQILNEKLMLFKIFDAPQTIEGSINKYLASLSDKDANSKDDAEDYIRGFIHSNVLVVS